MKKKGKQTKKADSVAKFINHITQPEEEKKNTYHYDSYFDMFEYKNKPVSDRFKEHLSRKLLDWAVNDDNAYKLSQFWIKEGIPPSDAERWRQNNEHIRRSYEIALLAIGNRRELGGLKKDLDSGMVKHTMPQYDKGWKDLAEWQSKLKEEAAGNGGTQIVVLDRIPDSDLVPSKLTPEEVAEKVNKRTATSAFAASEKR